MMNTEKRDFYKALVVPAFFVLIIWSIKILETISGISLSDYGLEPHTLKGLRGLITMPLLHSDFSHLSSNTLACFVLLFGLYLFYKDFASILFILLYLFSNFSTWIIGDSGTIHIGASGLVYALAWFHILSGFIKKNKQQAAFGLLVIFLYGSVVWDIFPMFQESAHISWQGHLGGAITGLVFAIYYRKKGIVIKEENDDNDEDEPSDDDPYWIETPTHNNHENQEPNQ